MQSHRVLWNVSLSTGENFRECWGKFEESEDKPAPWQQLLAYLGDTDAEITSLWLSTPDGARHILPSRGNRDNPLLKAFHQGEKPSRLRCFRRISDGGKGGQPEDLYTIAEATFETYKLQIFVSEYDPNLSWVLVVDNG